MKKIAITGGISSGKSTVCEMLAKQGCYIVSADAIVHHLLTFDREIQKQVIDLLGKDVIVDGSLSKEAIAKKVFSSPKTLKSLEQILHPAVFHDIESKYQSVKKNSNYDLFVTEIPLLYETDTAHLFDYVVAVHADQNLCEERFKKKHPKSSKTFAERYVNQMDPFQKTLRADFILLNNGNREDLQKQVINLLTKIRSI